VVGSESSVCGTYERTGILRQAGYVEIFSLRDRSEAMPNAEEALTFCRDATTFSIAERGVAGGRYAALRLPGAAPKEPLPADRFTNQWKLSFCGLLPMNGALCRHAKQDTSTWKLFLLSPGKDACRTGIKCRRCNYRYSSQVQSRCRLSKPSYQLQGKKGASGCKPHDIDERQAMSIGSTTSLASFAGCEFFGV